MTEQAVTETVFSMEARLHKIRTLLAKAESSKFPPEAAAYRAKAQQMMREYRVAEEDLIAQDEFSILPSSVEIDLCALYSDFCQDYINLAYWVALHSECEIGFKRDYRNNRMRATIVGYPGDLRQAEFLLSAALLAFGEHIEPTVKPDLSDEENIYRLRQAGISRMNVAIMVWGAEIGVKAAAHAKVGKIYKAECARRGENVLLDGKGISLGDFRAAYAETFNYRIAARLRDARDAAEGTFGTVLLHGRKERVQEAYYQLFPSHRPKAPTELELKEAAERAAKARKAVVKPKKRTKKEEQDIHRRHYSAAARAGASSGRAAADSVELTRQPRTGKIED